MQYEFDKTLDHRRNGSIRWKQPAGRDDILGMGTADLDFFCAPCVKEATQAVCDENTFNYRFKSDRYYEAVQNWFSRRYGMHTEREWLREIPSTIGSVRLTIGAMCHPGDYILMQSPYFAPLKWAIEGAGCRFLENPLVLKDGRYEVDFEDFEAKIRTYHPTMFILVSPHNPTGRVFTRQELARMADICAENGVVILSDEVHCLITYDGLRHTPILDASDRAREISILTFSFSKGFNLMSLPHAMTLIANEELRRRWDAYVVPFDFHYACNSFSIAAVTAIAEGGADAWLEEATAYLKHNRDLFAALVKERGIPLDPLPPEASFVYWIGCSRTGLDPDKLGEAFLEQAGISLNNGLEHGEQGRGFIRLNFGVTEQTLRQAVERIDRMFRK